MKKSKVYLRPELIAQITGLGLRANRVIEGSIAGLHRSPLHGLSPEFTEYREYTAGDDLKNLDWRAFARSERFYIKRFEDESNLRAYLVLDTSKSMSYGRAELTKYDYAATLTVSLAALLLKQRDSVALALCDTHGRIEIRSKATQSQLTKIVDLLESNPLGGETDLGKGLSTLADQIKHRSMIILISDLLTPLDDLYSALSKLQYAGHEILIFHILDPDELEFPFNDSVLFHDIEGKEEIFAEPWAFRKAYQEAMNAFLTEVQNRCQFGGVDYLFLSTSDPLGNRLSHFLHVRQRRGAVKHSGKLADSPKQ